jgi:hypothetical protein
VAALLKRAVGKRSTAVFGYSGLEEGAQVVREVETQDFMTADWSPLPYELLGRVANRIVNEVRGGEPCGLRRDEQAAGDNRVGVKTGAIGPHSRLGDSWVAQVELPKEQGAIRKAQVGLREEQAALRQAQIALRKEQIAGV